MRKTVFLLLCCCLVPVTRADELVKPGDPASPLALSAGVGTVVPAPTSAACPASPVIPVSAADASDWVTLGENKRLSIQIRRNALHLYKNAPGTPFAAWPMRWVDPKTNQALLMDATVSLSECHQGVGKVYFFSPPDVYDKPLDDWDYRLGEGSQPSNANNLAGAMCIRLMEAEKKEAPEGSEGTPEPRR